MEGLQGKDDGAVEAIRGEIRHAAAAIEEALRRLRTSNAAVAEIGASESRSCAAALRAMGEEEKSVAVDRSFLLHSYLADPRGADAASAWGGAHANILAFCDAYQQIWNRRKVENGMPLPVLSLLAVRLLENLYKQLCWEHLRYGPYADDLWSWAGRLFLEALDHGYAHILVGDAGKEEHSVLGAYTRLVALHAAAPEKLPSELMPTLFALVDRYASATRLEPGFVSSAQYMVDPASGETPRRLAKVPDAFSGLWFIETWQAAARLATPNPAGAEEPDGNGMGLGLCQEHLATHWKARPPLRRYKRHRLNGKMDAIEGLPRVIDALDGVAAESPMTWDAYDVSRGGLGVHAEEDGLDQLEIGDLVLVRPRDGGNWLLGMIRRFEREADGRLYLGLETVSSRLSMVEVDDGRNSARAVLCDPVRKGEAMRIVSATGSFAPGAPLYLTAGGNVLKLVQMGAARSTLGYELAVYQVR